MSELDLSWFVLGGSVALDAVDLAFLASSIVVWGLAAWAAPADVPGGPGATGRVRYRAAFVATLVASLFTVVAGDPLTFFVGYSVLGIAAYPLVAHRGTPASRRAARAYLVFMLVGEGALLAVLMTAWVRSGFDRFPLPAVAPALGALLVVGFGVKAGIPGLHAWMPAAYAVTPPAAASAIAGATVGIGVLGLARFGAFDGAAGLPAELWVVLGAVGAALGVVRGLVRSEPERILAYSSVSQMGIAIAVLGAASADGRSDAPTLAVTAFLFHHALAKSSLFLGLGALRGGGSGGRPAASGWRLAALALPALALCGVPFTSGSVAKGALAGAVHGSERLEAFLVLSSIGTTALMLHFLDAVRGTSRPGGVAPVRPWLASVAAVAVGLWVWPAFRPMAHHALLPSALAHAAWPPAAGAAAWLVLRALGWRGTSRTSVADRAADGVGRRWDAWLERRTERRPRLRRLPIGGRRAARHLVASLERQVGVLDRRVGTWTLTGGLFLVVALALRMAL